MKKHGRKFIAPIVITAIVLLYFCVYFGALIFVVNGIWKYLIGIIPAAFAIAMIATCVQRIKEIKGGEEDDIGKY